MRRVALRSCPCQNCATCNTKKPVHSAKQTAAKIPFFKLEPNDQALTADSFLSATHDLKSKKGEAAKPPRKDSPGRGGKELAFEVVLQA